MLSEAITWSAAKTGQALDRTARKPILPKLPAPRRTPGRAPKAIAESDSVVDSYLGADPF